jgi:nitrogen-specific signal transduction histidine kinase
MPSVLWPGRLFACKLTSGITAPASRRRFRTPFFEPFVSYGKTDGRGLALTIAKKIVEDHGGEIYVDGRSGTGTLFKITIPFAIPR